MGPKSPLISEESYRLIDEWNKRYPADHKRSGVLQALHIVQQEKGWLSPELMDAVADYFELPHSSVYEIGTFYTLYYLKPVGKHVIDVCTNVSCMLNGADQIAEHFKKRLNIDFNETTADGKFTLKEVECLGACIRAPVCQIGSTYHESLTPEKVDHLLAELAREGGIHGQ